jgi:N-acyl-L-homoserine lactone synthetase
VKGSLRLLPTTGPTLLAECFADTLADAVRLSAPTIWEATRFCIDYRLFDRGLLDGLFFASAEMIAGLGDVAVSAGIESIVGNFDASVFRHGRPIYLGLFPISELLVRSVKRRLANARRAFAGMERMVA